MMTSNARKRFNQDQILSSLGQTVMPTTTSSCVTMSVIAGNVETRFSAMGLFTERSVLPSQS